MTKSKRALWIVFFSVLYLATSVPVGLFIYSLKSDAGLNIFSKTGFHSYMFCLKEQVSLVQEE